MRRAGRQQARSACPVTPTTSGAASKLTVATPPGSHTLTATGAGADGTTHSTTVVVTVTTAPPDDFTIAVSPRSRTVRHGQTTTYTVTLTARSGDNAPVTLSVSGLPSGPTVSWSSNPATPTSGGTKVTLEITTTRTTTLGTYTLTITGTGSGGTPTHSTTATLTVT